MKIDKKKSIFLLGGYDLEMLTIKELLLKQGFKENKNLFDKKLSWGAKLSDYKEEIEQNSNKTFYAIELSIDDKKFYNRYKEQIVIIDHHNENSYKPTSLEQVIELLDIEKKLDKETKRYYKLVAANDRDYINGLKCAGATEDEIKEIRAKDRVAQGVTPIDETRAKNDVRSRKEQYGIVTICATTDKFSAITDELYNDTKPYNPSRYIIYNDKEIVFYGFSFNSLEYIFGNFKKGLKYYSGRGYCGVINLESKEIEVLKDMVLEKNKEIISTHIFLFPFRFDKHIDNDGFKNEFEFYKKNSLDERVDLDALHQKLTDNGWKYEEFKIEQNDEQDLLYNEFAYFYDYAREALYNLTDFSKDAISNFYRKESIQKGIFEIDIKGKEKYPETTYRLEIDGITLRVFSSGIAILGIELLNKEYNSFRDILRINDYGRRIYPQYIGKDCSNTTKGSFLANHIKVVDKKGSLVAKESFYYANYKDIRIGSHIMEILGTKIFTQCKCKTKDNNSNCANPYPKKCEKNLKDLFYIQPSLDDRMFLHCWYGNESLATLCSNEENKAYLTNDLWYEFIFVDNDGATVKNSKFKKELLKKATYTRWSGNKTLFGVSRYSFVALTDRSWFANNILHNHMRSMYFQISILLLAIRTSVLRFSDEIAALASLENFSIERTDKVYKKYLLFYNRLYFKEVTHQDQGIELYDMALKQMKIAEHIAKLNNKFPKLFEYANLKESEKESNAMNTLTILGGIFLVPSFVASILSLDAFKAYDSVSAVIFSLFFGWLLAEMIVSVNQKRKFWNLKTLFIVIALFFSMAFFSKNEESINKVNITNQPIKVKIINQKKEENNATK